MSILVDLKNWALILAFMFVFIMLSKPCVMAQDEMIKSAESNKVENEAGAERQFKLETMVVTATKSEAKIQEVPVTVNVVDSEGIDLMPNCNALDALRTIPGMYVSNTGNRPTLYGRSGQSLFMIDGQPGQSSGITYFFYNDLFSNPDGVERIEVVSGPGSVLYGANAQGAVVNVITKPGKKDPFFDVYYEIGEAQYTKTSFTVGAGNDTLTYYLNGSYTERGNWLDSDHEDVNYTDYRKRNIFGRVDYYPTDQTVAEFTLNHSEGQEWFHYRDPVPWTMYSDVEPRNTMLASSISHDFRVNSSISINLSYANRNHKDITWLMTGRPDQGEPNFFTTMKSEVAFGELRYSHGSQLSSWLNQKLTLGGSYDHTGYSGDWLYKTMYGDMSVSEDRTDNVFAVYIQEELSISQYVRLIIGGRYDKHPNFDGEFSPRIGLSILPNSWLTFYSSYNESFRSPSFSDRFGLFYANPDLEPEKGKTVEVGMKVTVGKGANFSVVYYDSKYDDMIQADMAELLMKNIGEAYINGWEGSLTLSPSPHIGLSGAFNIREAEDKIQHTELMGMPENIYTATLYLQDLYGFNLSTVYQYVDKRYGDQANSFFAPSYEKVDLKVSYTLGLPRNFGWGRQVEIYTVVNNFFNEDNVQAWYPGYHQPGRMIWGGIKYSW